LSSSIGIKGKKAANGDLTQWKQTCPKGVRSSRWKVGQGKKRRGRAEDVRECVMEV